MCKFSLGLFAGAVVGMGVAMMDKRTVKRAKKFAKHMMMELGV